MPTIPTPEVSIPQIPLERRVPADKYFHFSLSYWREIDFFGIGDQETHWFSSLFEHLKSLGLLKISELTTNPDLRSRLRFHRINWDAKNIPIQKEDLSNLPEYILEGEENEFFQFQLSKGSGRVIGFFDFQHVFQIVLLDPKHNLQPSKHYNYSVDRTLTSSTHYESLLTHLNTFICQFRDIECDNLCKPVTELEKWIGEEYGLIHYLPITDADSAILEKFMDHFGASSIGEVIDYILESATLQLKEQ